LQAVGAGQTLAFGPLAVSSGGIAVGAKPGLPWNEVKEIQVVQGAVRIKQPGKILAYGSVEASNVPNLYTFLALTQQLTQGRALWQALIYHHSSAGRDKAIAEWPAAVVCGLVRTSANEAETETLVGRRVARLPWTTSRP